MKCTPHSTMTSASVSAAFIASASESPTMSATRVENLRHLVVVRQDHRVALALEPVDRGNVGRVQWPFHARDDVRHLLKDRVGLGGYRVGVG